MYFIMGYLDSQFPSTILTKEFMHFPRIVLHLELTIPNKIIIVKKLNGLDIPE